MKRYLAIDYGESKIGIALSDPLKILAREYKVIWQKDTENVIEEIQKMCIENNVEKIILGQPISLDGNKNSQAMVVEVFKERLEVLGLPIVYVDERYSTKRAEEMMREQKKTEEEIKLFSDAVAARVILQDYLDYN